MSFAPGELVMVKNDWPEASGPVHIRTPHYLRGHQGRVIRYLGDYPNPEDLAFARPASKRPLYHVAFYINELWPEGARTEGARPEGARPDGKRPEGGRPEGGRPEGGRPEGRPGDEVIVEIYEHWLDRP
jgi:nitrile hydratase